MRRIATLLAATVFATAAHAERQPTCTDLPDYAALKSALKDAASQKNGGFSLPMWGTIVDRSGIVCAVAFSGATEDSQWPGSRAISAQKANTANAFSLPGLALSTANLYSATQPGGSLYGLQASNPVNTSVVYEGNVMDYGTNGDPMVGKRIGGVNVFGGGLALYNDKGVLLGGLGVSGDSSCADHNIAWRMRSSMKLDYVPAGVAKDKSDQITYDITNGKSASGWGHASCSGSEAGVVRSLPAVEKATAAAPATKK
jgi:uncharacterized protein GlcG (DUF336 family)